LRMDQPVWCSDREHGLGPGLVAFERGDHEREAAGAGEQADGDLRFQAALPGEPAFAEPSPASVPEYRVLTS
jgi:hypothetical protein